MAPYVFNPFTGTLDDTGAATSGDSYTTNNYSSIALPQLFNPDASAVTANTDDYTLSSSNSVAFVTLNGQTLDDSEYSLSGTTLTVTPDVGFSATSDEVLVFQHSFSVSTNGAVFGITTKTADYTATSDDYTILCDATTASLTITLPASTDNSGRVFNIKKIDSSVNTVTIDGNLSETIDGATTVVITTQYESVQIQNNGTEWYIL